jgi:hypothetical protein
MPAAARRAAVTPDCAARPAWNGFVMVPKFATTPAESEAAIPSAIVACSGSRRRRLAQAAAAATGPITAVGCQPLR